MQILKGKNVLVTGCAGFLGSWLCKSLVEKGARVTGLSREYKPDSMIHEIKDQTTLIEGSVENLDLLLGIIHEHKIEFIYHLAAQALVGVASKDPVGTFKSNIEGTWNVLEAARVLGQSIDVPDRMLRGIIVASSDKAYGDQENLPYFEDAPMKGRFPYDVSKSCADLIAKSYYYSYKLPICITRCGNLFGAGDLNFSRIIPDTIIQSLNGKPVTIRSDGTPVRDYLYVKDAANAYAMLSERMWNDTGIYGEAFNISNQTPMSVLDVVQAVLKVTGRTDLAPVVLGTASREIDKQFLDATKIREVLGWKPEHDFESGLKETIEWYKHSLKSPVETASV
ncbi:MAG: GDP-mannose 4,6-dehydratase [Candidatus Melainabacteria bacterium]|jgi:CDP-glucose 4,6-dehydratase|nr:GDP-mannose 4,6-dehydratase [Candidatus Melainabacteria bacterium]